jgi:endonuclease/exonuclease/phosphatase family metal-dependent hydrolase
MWSDYAYGRNAVYPEGHHGNAVLSRFPLNIMKTATFPWGERKTRPALLPHYAAHGAHPRRLRASGLREAHRQAQLKMLAEWANALPDGEPVVVAGDFNDWRQRATIR